ncbi:MAG: hypothetical protein ACJAU6_001980 [Alphaproteobacteria bacterium]
MIALRTITHHINVLTPGFQVTHRFGESVDEIRFQLDRNEIQAIVESVKAESGKYKINESGRRYLNNVPEKINVRVIYKEYFRRVRAFHDWFSHQFESHTLKPLKDFERCLEENKDNAERIWWKLLLRNWLSNENSPKNPYEHLHRFLSDRQIKDILHLPRKSTQQVDKVIEFIDEKMVCDEEIRKLVYELFLRAPD